LVAAVGAVVILQKDQAVQVVEATAEKVLVVLRLVEQLGQLILVVEVEEDKPLQLV
tara:strand:- start:239 stop:406 length:168 start_codon:yes stop_codon:yes gene_type:complete